MNAGQRECHAFGTHKSHGGCLICTDVYTRAWGRPYAFCEALRFEGRARQRGITVCRQAAGVRRPKLKFRRSGSLFGSRA